MNKLSKKLALALALLGAGTSAANAAATIIYHSDGTRDLVITNEGTRGTVVYRDNGDGRWHDQGYHGEAHPHWDVVNRRTGPDDSVGDYRPQREPREPREPRQIEPKEPKEPREHHFRERAE